MDTDGAIRRIGPSQATGVRMGDQSGVYASKHVRWSGSRRVASNGGQFRRDFRPLRPLKTVASRRAGGVRGWAATGGRLMTPRDRGPGWGAQAGLLYEQKIRPRARTPWARTCTRWGKKSIFFYELMPPRRIEGTIGAPRRVLPPFPPPEQGVPKSAGSGHVTPPTTHYCAVLGYVYICARKRHRYAALVHAMTGPRKKQTQGQRCLPAPEPALK